MKIIVGLGNPGPEYKGTRHNVGFEVVEELMRRGSFPAARRGLKALLTDGLLAGERVLLARPQTFMNASGESVGAIMRFYHAPLSDLIVVYDDVALEVGRIRLRYQGSAGGHNGMKSIIAHLHSHEVTRVRVGVGESRSGDMVNHVLGKFRGEEAEAIAAACGQAADACMAAVTEGFENAMNRFNPARGPAA